MPTFKPYTIRWKNGDHFEIDYMGSTVVEGSQPQEIGVALVGIANDAYNKAVGDVETKLNPQLESAQAEVARLHAEAAQLRASLATLDQATTSVPDRLKEDIPTALDPRPTPMTAGDAGDADDTEEADVDDPEAK